VEGRLKKSFYLVGILSLFLLIISGCGSINVSNSKVEKQVSEKTENISKTLKSEQPKATENGDSTSSKTQNNPLFQTTLTLPNGEIVSTNKSVTWKDLSIQLLVTSLPSSNNSIEGYKEIIGNHSTITSPEIVSTSGGQATLVLNERNSPAASKSPTYEYWAIKYGSQYAYAIEATVIGNKDNAKNEVINLLNQWKVPQ
jgi:hypothetical protein